MQPTTDSTNDPRPSLVRAGTGAAALTLVARGARLRQALLVGMLASLTPPAGAQTFSGGAAAPAFKRVMVPCSASPIFDLSKGTAFQINLCATPAITPLMRNLAKADGKIVAFLVCQDTAGGREFVWPAIVIGATPAPDLPRWCIAQNFLVAGNNLWATSTGARQSLIPAPGILSFPLVGGHYYNPGGISIHDATYGVTVTNNLPRATGYTAYYFDGIPGTYDGGNGACIAAANCPIRSLTVTFYLSTPPPTTAQSFGLVFSSAASAGQVSGSQGNIAVSCNYVYGAGINLVGWTPHGPDIVRNMDYLRDTVTLGSTFTTAGAPLMLRASQNAAGVTYCQYSTDSGTTWSANVSTWWGGSTISAGHMGLLIQQPDVNDGVYITGLSVLQ